MTKFLLPVLALAALSLSQPTLAEDGDVRISIIRPPQIAPIKPAHNTLDSIGQDDIRQYLDMIFSKSNEGTVHTTDGKIHRFSEPLNIEVAWPLCQDEAKGELDIFTKKTGIKINYSFVKTTKQVPSILILGIDSLEDLRLNPYWYEWLSTYGFKGSDDLDKIVKQSLDSKLYIQRQFFDNNDQIRFVSLIINKNVSSYDVCKVVFPGFIFGFLANTTVWAGNEHISDLDYLYISALYDDSILPDEPEDSARPKLAKLMSDKLERTK